MKYAGMQPIADALGGRLSSALPAGETFDAVIPVPLHWRRQWSRGFNQSELLARQVARRRGIPVLRALRRARATQSQTGLSNTRRRKNVTGAFRVRGSFNGARVLLVDDVMTTGATGSACAAALKAAGAGSVTLLTLARADRRLAPATAPKAMAMGA